MLWLLPFVSLTPGADCPRPATTCCTADADRRAAASPACRDAGTSASFSTSSMFVDVVHRQVAALRLASDPRRCSSRSARAGSRRGCPARRAASTFSLMPPTGSTRPDSVISPVIARLGSHRPAGQRRRQRRHHRHARRRTVLRNRAGRHVQVDLRVLVERRVDAVARRVRAEPRQRDARRLLHHVAELAGQRQLAGAGHARRFDEQHVAADRRPRQPDRDARIRACGPSSPRRGAAARRAVSTTVSAVTTTEPRLAFGAAAARSCGRSSRSPARGCGRRPRACSRG